MGMLINILLGVLPDVLYYFLMIKNIKRIKEKNILFFILLFISYFLCIMLIEYQFYLYIIADLLMFVIIKVLYDAKITDVFLIVVLELYLMIASAMCFILINNYMIAYLVNRIIIFLPLIFKKQLVKLYLNYNQLWNRHNHPNKIKSLTLRNISVVLLNFLILLSYVLLIYTLTVTG